MSSGRYDLESRRSKTFGLLSQTKGTFRKLDDQPITGIHIHRSLDEEMIDRELLHGRVGSETLTYNECAVDVEFSAKPKDIVDAKNPIQPAVTSTNETSKDGSVLNSPTHSHEESSVSKKQSPDKSVHTKSKYLDDKSKSDDKDKKHSGFLERLTKSWRRRDGDEGQGQGGRKKKTKKNGHHSDGSSSSESDEKSGKDKNGGQNGKEMFEIKLASSESQASLDTKLQNDHDDVTVIPISDFKVNDDILQGKAVFSTTEMIPLVKDQDRNGGLLPAGRASPKYTTFTQCPTSEDESPGDGIEGHEKCDSSSENSDEIVDMTHGPCFSDTLPDGKPVEHVYDKLEYKGQDVSPYEEIMFGNDAETLNNFVISLKPEQDTGRFPVSDNGIDTCLTSISYEDFDRDASGYGDEHVDTATWPLVEGKTRHPEADKAKHFLHTDDVYQSSKKRKDSRSSSSSSSSSEKFTHHTESSLPPNTFTSHPLDTLTSSPPGTVTSPPPGTATSPPPEIEAPITPRSEKFLPLDTETTPPVAETSISRDPDKSLPSETESPLTNRKTKSKKFKTFKLEATVVISPDENLSENTMTYFGPVFLKPQKDNGEEFFKVVVAPVSDEMSKMDIRREDTLLTGLNGQPCLGVAKLSSGESCPESKSETLLSDVTIGTHPPHLPTTCTGRDAQIGQLVVTSPSHGGGKGSGGREDRADASRKPEDLGPEINQSPAKLGSDLVANGVTVGECLGDVHGKKGPRVSDSKLGADEKGLDTLGRVETKDTNLNPLSYPLNPVSRSVSSSGTDSDSDSKASARDKESEPNVHSRQEGRRLEFLNPHTFLNRIKGSPKNVLGLSKAVKIHVPFGGHLYPETKRYKTIEETIIIEHVREPDPEQKTIELFTLPLETESGHETTLGLPDSDKNELLNSDNKVLENHLLENKQLQETSCAEKLLLDDMDKLSLGQQKTIVVSDVDVPSNNVDIVGYSSPVSSPKMLFKQMQNLNLTETRVDKKKSKDEFGKSDSSSSSSDSDSDSGGKSKRKSRKVNTSTDTRKNIASENTSEKSWINCQQGDKHESNEDKITVKANTDSVLQNNQESHSETLKNGEGQGSSNRIETKMSNMVVREGEFLQQSQVAEHVEPPVTESVSFACTQLHESNNMKDDNFSHGYHRDDAGTQELEDFRQSLKEAKTLPTSSPSFSSSSSHSDQESDDSGGQCSYDVMGIASPTDVETDAAHEGEFSEQRAVNETEQETENIRAERNETVHVDKLDDTGLCELESPEESTESLTFISNTSSFICETTVVEDKADLTAVSQPVWDDSVDKTYSSTSSFSSSDDEAKVPKTRGTEDVNTNEERSKESEKEGGTASSPVPQVSFQPLEVMSSDHKQNSSLPLSVAQKMGTLVCAGEKNDVSSPVDIPLEKLTSEVSTISSHDTSVVADESITADKNENKKANKEKTKKEKRPEKEEALNTKSVSPPTDSEQPKRKSKLFSWPFKRNKKKQEEIKQKEESRGKEEPEKDTKQQVKELTDHPQVKGDEVKSTNEELTQNFQRMTPRTSTPLRHEDQTNEDIRKTSEMSHDIGVLSMVDALSSPDQTESGLLEATLSSRSASKRSSSKSSSSSSSDKSIPDSGKGVSDSGIPSLSFISQVESVDINVRAESKLSSRPELCPEITKERSGSEESKSSSSSKENNQEKTSKLAKGEPSITKSNISSEAIDQNKVIIVDTELQDNINHNKEDAKPLKDRHKFKDKLQDESKHRTNERNHGEVVEVVPGEDSSDDTKQIKTIKPPRQKSKSSKKGDIQVSSSSSSSSGDDKMISTKHETTEEHHHGDNNNDKKTLQITKEIPALRSPDKKRSKLFGKKLPDLQIKQDSQLEELVPPKKDEPITGKSPATPRSKSGKISKFLPGLLSPTKKEPDVRLDDSLNADQRFDGQFHREDDITQGVAEDATGKEMKTPPPTPASENVHYDEGQCENQSDPNAVSQPRHFVVVAIDFGTTHSGYAFSFVRDPTSVYMMRRWAGEEPGVVNQKTLTSLLLTPEGEFHSFGYSARSCYLNLIPVEAKHWMYFSTFKMELHHNADLNRDTMLVALNGAKFSALKVFAYALDFFKSHALQQLSDQSGTELLNDDIRWVITVPAIWKAPAKQFMRQAAYEAGLASPSFPEQLLIALEPEAASIYCRRLRMHQLIPEQPLKRPLQSPSRSSVEVSGELAVTELTVDLNKSSSSSRATLDSLPDEIVDSQIQGSRYLIVDCGGGTVDITVHELDPLGHIVELHRATGGPHGSIGVDAEFEKLLCGIFGIEFIEHYKRKYPMGWVHLMTDFESRKRSASPYKSTSLNVSPPFTFINDYKKHKSDPETAVKRYGDPEVEWSPQGMLRLTPIAMRRLFLPTLTHIKQAVGDVLNHPNARELKYMFLVGGFAESPLLQHEMRQEFGSIMKILIPQEVSLAILKGAVLFGIDPSIVNVRRSRLTYGVGILNRFDSNIHPESKRVTKDGVDWCIDVFDKYVETDQPVMLGTSVVRSYTPAKKGQLSIILNIYSSLNPNVRFITDAGVTQCGTLCLSLATLEDATDAATGPREIQTRMSFGDTEISVVAIDVATGKLVKASVDFLGR